MSADMSETAIKARLAENREEVARIEDLYAGIRQANIGYGVLDDIDALLTLLDEARGALGALSQVVIDYLHVPTTDTRNTLAILVGEPVIPSSPPGSFLAARGALAWEDDDENVTSNDHEGRNVV